MRHTASLRLLVAASALSVSGLSFAGFSNATFAYSGGSTTNYLQLNGSNQVIEFSRGWVDQTGSNNGGGSGANYIAGVCGSSDGCFGNDAEYHNYFAFNFNNLFSGTVNTASLVLNQPSNGYITPASTITYTLFDVSSNPSLGSGVALYNDLGSGISYGTVVVDASSAGGLVTVNFNAAGLAALNAAVSNNTNFYVGGAVAAVPEPATWALSAAGLLLLALRRRAAQA
ncbi:hypothetical protein DBR47_02815 [Paucibacter sp. KBW04]|uniref:PEP-CTERM sorting domain-containing protein n=1 Tax=Paucibacter sp. KBW04 TaxID=2153361 RepID=UPI000F55C6B8|nr:PEP-CTERM sorting domain-containing protein [Paucibacter sp. KBW04]RQO63481.1 hypothetical protein DBR47_02815 [Paucibacter sp. KBW04]